MELETRVKNILHKYKSSIHIKSITEYYIKLESVLVINKTTITISCCIEHIDKVHLMFHNICKDDIDTAIKRINTAIQRIDSIYRQIYRNKILFSDLSIDIDIIRRTICIKSSKNNSIIEFIDYRTHKHSIAKLINSTLKRLKRFIFRHDILGCNSFIIRENDIPSIQNLLETKGYKLFDESNTKKCKEVFAFTYFNSATGRCIIITNMRIYADAFEKYYHIVENYAKYINNYEEDKNLEKLTLDANMFLKKHSIELDIFSSSTPSNKHMLVKRKRMSLNLSTESCKYCFDGNQDNILRGLKSILAYIVICKHYDEAGLRATKILFKELPLVGITSVVVKNKKLYLLNENKDTYIESLKNRKVCDVHVMVQNSQKLIFDTLVKLGNNIFQLTDINISNYDMYNRLHTEYFCTSEGVFKVLTDGESAFCVEDEAGNIFTDKDHINQASLYIN